MASAISRSPRKPARRSGRKARSILVSGLAAVFLLGCVGPEPGNSDAATTYHCEDGTFFSAEFLGRSARVTTLRNSYLLERRRSSIGRKYSEGDVFFIQDEDRAVLVGAADGPYRRCAER